jgi:hypothetical protein
MYHARS